MAADPAEKAAYDELQAYTLTRGDETFIHQHVVDTWIAQHADGETKPLPLTFSLVGLYLHVEKGMTGRRVQQIHMMLAQRKRVLPSFVLPIERGTMTASQVLTAPAGPERDRAIDAWCASVWEAFRGNRDAVIALLRECDLETTSGS